MDAISSNFIAFHKPELYSTSFSHKETFNPYLTINSDKKATQSQLNVIGEAKDESAEVTSSRVKSFTLQHM